MSNDGGQEAFCPDGDGLYFVPLGGAGEIGMNLYLYGYAGKWLLIDLGITFADDSLPGIDVLVPDPAFIRDQRENIVGLVLTHAHEDHLGAVPYLWADLECPIYATPFTAAMLRSKLTEGGLLRRVPLHEVGSGVPFTVGPFDLHLVAITHSIPEAHAVVIRTPVGTVVHSGDWKLDPTPMVGPVTDSATLAALGDEGVAALVCDSTNAMVAGHSGSESEVRACLAELCGRFHNRIAITCFASNVARLESIGLAAAANGRSAALVGRSLWRVSETARVHGYLRAVPGFLTERDARQLPRDRVLMACTGSQGEARSALARIASGDHPHISLDRGDVVIFSSRVIPGNERALALVQNRLVRRGIEVLTSDDEPVHVSGHPARDELAQMYRWLRPRLAVPIHGETRHLMANAQLAEECQVPQTLVPHNGTVLRLAPDPAQVATVPVGRLAVDGKRLVGVDAGSVRSRRRMVDEGAVVVTVVLTGAGELAGAPQVSALGLLDDQDDHDGMLDVVDAVREGVGALPRAARLDDQVIRHAVRTAARRAFKASHGKKPLTEVHVVRM